MISESSFNQKNPKEAIKNSAIIHEAFTFESQTANENLSEQFAKCSSLLLGESVISQMDFINNYLIAEAYEAPFPFQPKSLRELQKGISILNAIIQNRIVSALTYACAYYLHRKMRLLNQIWKTDTSGFVMNSKMCKHFPYECSFV